MNNDDKWVNPDLRCYLCRRKDHETADWSSITVGAIQVDVCWECMSEVWEAMKAQHFFIRRAQGEAV